MRIDYILKKEDYENLARLAISKKESFSIINIFNKARFIETLWDSMILNTKVNIIIDEISKTGYNIIDKNSMFVIKEKNLFDFFNSFDGFEVKVKKEKIILEITKVSSDKLSLCLKLDRDRTIDLKMLDDTFSGVRSYYRIIKK